MPPTNQSTGGIPHSNQPQGMNIGQNAYLSEGANSRQGIYFTGLGTPLAARANDPGIVYFTDEAGAYQN